MTKGEYIKQIQNLVDRLKKIDKLLERLRMGVTVGYDARLAGYHSKADQLTLLIKRMQNQEGYQYADEGLQQLQTITTYLYDIVTNYKDVNWSQWQFIAVLEEEKRTLKAEGWRLQDEYNDSRSITDLPILIMDRYKFNMA